MRIVNISSALCPYAEQQKLFAQATGYLSDALKAIFSAIQSQGVFFEALQEILDYDSRAKLVMVTAPEQKIVFLRLLRWRRLRLCRVGSSSDCRDSDQYSRRSYFLRKQTGHEVLLRVEVEGYAIFILRGHYVYKIPLRVW